MKIDFLVPDIHSPVLGPVTTLARHLAGVHDARIVGPDFGHGICPMYRGTFDYTVIPAGRLYRFPEYFRERRRLSGALAGDVIVAVKAFGGTVPVALQAKRRSGCKVIVYLDEWDGALMAMRTMPEKIGVWMRHFHHPLEDNYVSWVERQIKDADRVISTTRFLQRKFGGSVLQVGVDCEFFKPALREATEQLRGKLGLTGKRLIVFGGVARPHKGLDWILEALAILGREDIRFLIVGPVNEHVKALMAHERWGRYLSVAGSQPQARMPEFLSLADLVVLPQQDNLLAQSQMPCKIFEAMAMARPIIASHVADLPEVLEGCGWTVPAGDTRALADSVGQVLDDAGAAQRAGEAAREKCKTLYSEVVTRKQLLDIIVEVGGSR